MAHIRTYKELMALRPTMVERRLIRKAKAGDRCVLGAGDLPPEGPANAEREIRAEVLRYLILGGCPRWPTDESGVSLEGGHITATLDLDFTKARGPIRIKHSRFDKRLEMEQVHCKLLNLGGCYLAGLRGQRITVEGSVFLRGIRSFATIAINSAKIGGQVSLSTARLHVKRGEALNAQGAEIGGNTYLKGAFANAPILLNSAKIVGQLVCNGAQLTVRSGYALNAQGAEVTDGVYLKPLKSSVPNVKPRPTTTTGGLNFSRARIGGIFSNGVNITATDTEAAINARYLTISGPLILDGCQITGPVNLTGATVTGDLTCRDATFKKQIPKNQKDKDLNNDVFVARRMRVVQSLIWRKKNNTRNDQIAYGKVILDGAHVAELDDDPNNWPEANHLSLDGFTYDRIAENTSFGKARKNWLQNGSVENGKLFPQPYSQFAKFLRETGHDSQAREVLLERETLVREYEREELNGWNWTRRSIGDWLQKISVGYGHDPFRSVKLLILLIFLAIFPTHLAWEEGSFAPNAAPILVSAQWSRTDQREDNPAAVWSGEVEPAFWRPQPYPNPWHNLAPGRDWESFNRYAYAADIVIPLIDFGQTEAWAPSTTRGWWGWHLWWLRWVFTVFGWIVTALGAAAITGIIRRE